MAGMRNPDDNMFERDPDSNMHYPFPRHSSRKMKARGDFRRTGMALVQSGALRALSLHEFLNEEMCYVE